MADKTVTISLRRDEALLLDSFLRRYTEDDLLNPSESESQALFNLACLLEKELPELLLPEYSEIVEKASREIFVNED